jgi:pimeloyl-ACP methyl ester carboxylesterase
MLQLFFYPANGIAHEAYTPLLNELSAVHSFVYPPLLADPPDPSSFRSWDELLNVMDHAMVPDGAIGFGHSLGGTLLLYDAIKHPKRWARIVIIDPALFSPTIIRIYRWVQWLKLEPMIHPMVRITNKRRDTFDSKERLFEHWRTRALFAQVSDEGLRQFIDASVVKQNDQWVLRFSKDWEAKIYATMCSLDPFIWAHITKLESDLTVVAGETSTTFKAGARHCIKPHALSYIEIPNTTHLLPFETPVALSKIILHGTKR